MAKNKEVKASNDINDELAKELAKSFDINAERVWWEKVRKMVEGGAISVRGVKATIKKVESETGNAPTIKSSMSQYFLDAFSVCDLEGAKVEPLKDILNATIQATRKLGGRGEDGETFNAFMKGVTTFKAFAKKVESLPKREKSESDGVSVADFKALLATADGTISLALGALREVSGDEAVISNVENAKALINLVSVLLGGAQSAKERHPSKAKVSA